jgi:GntR family transcriptional regulator
MTFSLDRQSRSPYPMQVVRQAVAQLVAGRLHPGDRLPSVRQLARELRISRTTAERIHEALCESMLAEVRPRSGAFVASGQVDQVDRAQEMHAVYDFLKETVARARVFGLDAGRLIQLLGAFAEGGLDKGGRETVFPLVATRDFFECVRHCLGAGFPAKLIHLSPDVREPRVPPYTRYLLSSYYMRARAQKLAESLHCSLLYVRYNVKLLDESMKIGPREHRYFVTRDPDNAATTRVFLASAYPEVPAKRYTVQAVEEWLSDGRALNGRSDVWATFTAAPRLEGRVDPGRLRILDPVLAEDFIDELRCLALLG